MTYIEQVQLQENVWKKRVLNNCGRDSIIQVMKTLFSLWSMDDSARKALSQSKELDSFCTKRFQIWKVISKYIFATKIILELH